MSNTQERQTERSGRSLRLTPPLALITLAAVSLIISLTSAAWVYSPANPAGKVPATSLSFSDLRTLIGSGKVPITWVQDAYFGWFAWLLLVVVIVLGVAAVVTRGRYLAGGTLVVAVLGLVMTVFAFKGELSWAQYWDARTNLRLGGYLVFLGYILAAVSAGLAPRRK